MGKPERRAYLEAIRARYRRARKGNKTLILNEFCAVCGCHRKLLTMSICEKSYSLSLTISAIVTAELTHKMTR
jgi:hypothetical protein